MYLKISCKNENYSDFFSVLNKYKRSFLYEISPMDKSITVFFNDQSNVFLSEPNKKFMLEHISKRIAGKLNEPCEIINENPSLTYWGGKFYEC